MCVFRHRHGLMKCQNETVSTTVRMCFHISLFVYKTQYLKKKVMESSETNNTDNLAKIQKKIEGSGKV